MIRAGRANLFLSDIFTTSFVNVNNVAVEFYEGDGSFGAAIGAGIGAGVYTDADAAMQNRNPTSIVEPKNQDQYNELYDRWRELLEAQLNK